MNLFSNINFNGQYLNLSIQWSPAGSNPDAPACKAEALSQLTKAHRDLSKLNKKLRKYIPFP